MGRIIRMIFSVKKQTKKEVNSEGLQSCRWCPIGTGSYKVESDEGTYYVCKKHKKEFKI